MYVENSLYDGKDKSVKGGKGRGRKERGRAKQRVHRKWHECICIMGPIRSDFPWRKFGGDWAHRISLEYVFGMM